jgi:KipI family sensor histidine kinase inhibitor
VGRPAGDRHLTLELAGEVSPETTDVVYATEAILRATWPAGLRETTPAYCSLLVRYNPLETDYETLARVGLEAVRAAAKREAGHGRARAGGRGTVFSGEVVIPVVYGGEWGPDLGEVARHTGLSPDEVAARHAAGLYRVAMVGFAPGFGYLTGMDPALATPRRRAPRPVVPQGSVGIAGEQTGVYPGALPGGWQIIGRTPLPLWDPEAAEPTVIAPGRPVRFVDAGTGRKGWARAERLAEGFAAAGPGRVRGVGAESATGLARVRAAGPLDTIQDAGRWDRSGLGLPESGALDWPALAAANVAAGNGPDAAALEVTYGGLVLEFIKPVTVAVSPGGLALLRGDVLAAGRAAEARPGDTLEFRPGSCPRVYLAFGGGGVACPLVLGSRSTYLPAGLGGLEGRKLRSGDVVMGFAPAPASGGLASGSPTAAWARPLAWAGPFGGAGVTVRAVPGPQEHLFSPEAVRAFFDTAWRALPGSDRRSCLLDGPELAAPAGSGVSDGSPAGSVQVPPSGKPLVLLGDHQTTGGYPKLATVIGPDLPLLARVQPGGEVRFRPVDVTEARRVWLAMPSEVAWGWPGNGMTGRPEGGARRRVMVLGLGGQSHLVAVEQTPPR